MKKKITVLIVIMSMTLFNVIPVFADPGPNEYTGNSSQNVPATLDASTASYTLKLPAEISLAYVEANNDYEGSGDYFVKGTISVNQYVKIKLSGSGTFDMTGSSGATISATAALLKNSKSTTVHAVTPNTNLATFLTNLKTQDADFSSADSSELSGWVTALTSSYPASASGKIEVTTDVPAIADEFSGNVTVNFSLSDIS